MTGKGGDWGGCCSDGKCVVQEVRGVVQRLGTVQGGIW